MAQEDGERDARRAVEAGDADGTDPDTERDVLPAAAAAEDHPHLVTFIEAGCCWSRSLSLAECTGCGQPAFRTYAYLREDLEDTEDVWCSIECWTQTVDDRFADQRGRLAPSIISEEAARAIITPWRDIYTRWVRLCPRDIGMHALGPHATVGSILYRDEHGVFCAYASKEVQPDGRVGQAAVWVAPSHRGRGIAHHINRAIRLKWGLYVGDVEHVTDVGLHIAIRGRR